MILFATIVQMRQLIEPQEILVLRALNRIMVRFDTWDSILSAAGRSTGGQGGAAGHRTTQKHQKKNAESIYAIADDQ